MQEDRIQVFTVDSVELDNCHVSRARMLVKSKKAVYITIDDVKCLMLNKSSVELDIKNVKEKL